QYVDEDVTLAHESEPAESMPPRFDDKEGLLSVTPPNGLVQGDHYTVSWPKLRGIGTASRGRGAEVTFEVGAADDTEAPRFDGLTQISWDVDRNRDDCTNNEEERFWFDVTVGAASDDSGTDSLRLVVLQSRGGDVGESGEPVQVLQT